MNDTCGRGVVSNAGKHSEDVRTEMEGVVMTVASVLGYLRESNGQQAATSTPLKLRLAERPHPDLMRN